MGRSFVVFARGDEERGNANEIFKRAKSFCGSEKCCRLKAGPVRCARGVCAWDVPLERGRERVGLTALILTRLLGLRQCLSPESGSLMVTGHRAREMREGEHNGTCTSAT